MPKRITYLTKREDLPLAQFRVHWSTRHAAIAVELPGVVSYRQNHLASQRDTRYDIDGIVELWFASDDVVSAGLASSVADRLIVDERLFLSGLVGGPVDAGEPTAPWRHKVWLLARWSGERTVDAVRDWAETVAVQIRAAGFAVNITDDSGTPLVREALHANPRPPQVAVCFGFSTSSSAAHAISQVRAASAELTCVESVDIRIAEEVVIV